MANTDINTLVRTYGRKVYNIAYRITGNQHDAEDVAQETFLQVHRGLAGFRGDSSIYTWIYRIAVNASLQSKRRINRATIDSLDDIASILQIDKNTVKVRLHRAKTALGAYFSGRCQWIEGSGDCSCESRLGFALSAAPEIVNRLKNRPPDAAMKEAVRKTVGEVMDIDEIYANLPLEEYRTEALESYLKGA